MSQELPISERHHAVIRSVAAQRGETPETFVLRWNTVLSSVHGPVYGDERTLFGALDEFAAIVAMAAECGESPEAFVARWAAALTHGCGEIYHDEEDLLRALGAHDAEIEEMRQLERDGEASNTTET